MKVYIVTHELDYESADILLVTFSLKKARERMYKEFNIEMKGSNATLDKDEMSISCYGHSIEITEYDVEKESNE